MKIKQAFFNAGLILFFSLLLILLLEGVSSLFFVVREIGNDLTTPVAERKHTQYDELLGWSNIPNSNIQDMYNPGVSLQINSQGFRNKKEFTPNIPEGMKRIICSGDSFTLGYGVSNHQSWCHLLSLKEIGIETINMGQGGYGIDQAYLWYKRDGKALDHDLHIFAFITDDFYRAEKKRFLGYEKPFFTIEDNALKLNNVPVPQWNFSGLSSTLAGLNKLRVVSLARELLQNTQTKEDEKERSIDQLKQIISKIFEDLWRINKEKNSALVLVHLPVREEYKNTGDDRFREELSTFITSKQILYIDLIKKLRKLPEDKIEPLFLQKGDVQDFAHAEGHFSVKGNEYFSDLIYERLRPLLKMP